jgi:hypothetical protein
MIGEKFSEHFSWTLDIVLRSEKSKEFVVLPKLDWWKRQCLARGESRRLNRRRQVLPQTREAFVYLAMTRIMLGRLDKAA